jgi:hypothetical protein
MQKGRLDAVSKRGKRIKGIKAFQKVLEIKGFLAIRGVR